MQAIAPNLTVMVGELVGARLIAHAGSLMNLAKHPASTVQILGAEKALFRALKTKHETPKYGLIYHASVIGQTAPKNKGKISRVLAAKTALAIRYQQSRVASLSLILYFPFSCHTLAILSDDPFHPLSTIEFFVLTAAFLSHQHRVDALGDSKEATIGYDNRAKVEARMRQLETGTTLNLGGKGKVNKETKKYTKAEENGVGAYNAKADINLKRKKDETEGEDGDSKSKKKQKKEKVVEEVTEPEEKVQKKEKKEKKKKKDKEKVEAAPEPADEPVQEKPKKEKKEKKKKKSAE